MAIQMNVKYSYLCQMWGEEFESNPIKLDRPERIRDLCRDPAAFEKLLREHITAFTNPGNCPKFGKTEKGFLYSGSLQLRYLPQSDTAIRVNTFLRNDSIQQDFIAKLLKLMLLDFSDHLACGYIVSDAIVPGAHAIKLKHQKRIGFFKQPIGISDEELFIQQSQLIQGLEQEPTKQWYRAITTVDKTRKAALQKRLRETIVIKASVNLLTDLPTQRETTLNNARGTPTLYSLCNYLQGYTYFDLLKEIAEVRLEETLEIVAEHEKQLIKESHDKLMDKIDIFSSPASMDNQYIGSTGFATLRTSLESFLSYQYNPDKHEIVQDEPAYEDTYLMRLETGVAIECVLRFARICKDTHYGYDTSSRRMEIY